MLILPAIKCSFGKQASVFQTGYSVANTNSHLLEGDPRSQNWKNLDPAVREMDEKLQRKTSKARRQAMKDYILRRMAPTSSWIGTMPPIVIGMQVWQKFEPISEEDSTLGRIKVASKNRPSERFSRCSRALHWVPRYLS